MSLSAIFVDAVVGNVTTIMTGRCVCLQCESWGKKNSISIQKMKWLFIRILSEHTYAKSANIFFFFHANYLHKGEIKGSYRKM